MQDAQRKIYTALLVNTFFRLELSNTLYIASIFCYMSCLLQSKKLSLFNYTMAPITV